MASTLNMLLVIVMMLNLFALGTSRLSSIIRIVAVQGALLGVMPLLVHEHSGLAVYLLSAAAILLKSLVIPWMLTRALRRPRSNAKWSR